MELFNVICNILISALVSWLVSGCMGSYYFIENDKKLKQNFDDMSRYIHKEIDRLINRK